MTVPCSTKTLRKAEEKKATYGSKDPSGYPSVVLQGNNKKWVG